MFWILNKKMTIETVTVTNGKEILGQAVLENLGNEVQVSQSTLIREGLYEVNYPYIKEMIKKYSHKEFGENIKIDYTETK